MKRGEEPLDVVVFRLPGVDAEEVRRIVGLVGGVRGNLGCRVAACSAEEVEAVVEAERRAEDVQGAVVGRAQVIRAMEELGQREGREGRAAGERVVVVLSDVPEERNWFSFHHWGASGLLLFVHAARLKGYFPGVDGWVPVAHLVASGVLHGHLFPEMGEWEKQAHEEPRGCLMDLCRHKSQIRLKMLAADVCSECAELARQALAEGRLERKVLFGVLRTCSEIRTRFIALEREAMFHEVGVVRITGELKVVLDDWGEVKLEPRDRAAYIALLRAGKFDRNARSRWQQVYSTVRSQCSGRKVSPLDERGFNQAVARIRRALREVSSEAVADALLWKEQAAVRVIRREGWEVVDSGR